jgi:hypothetical protein
MTRAEANACWLLADQNRMSIEPIKANDKKPELLLTWGTDIIEFNGSVNSEHQVKNSGSASVGHHQATDDFCKLRSTIYTGTRQSKR